MQETSTVLLASNHFLNNQNLLQILSKYKINICNKSQVNTKESIIPELETYKPNYLFVSTSLPGVISMQEVVEKARQISPKTKIVLVTNESDASNILNYLLANTDAMIRHENLNECLDFSIGQLVKEQMFLCGMTINQLKGEMQKCSLETKSDVGLLKVLTDREVEVLYSLTEGINYKQISSLLYISESTVKTHINNIFTKLNVNDRTQAVLYALKHGIENLSKKSNLFNTLVKK